VERPFRMPLWTIAKTRKGTPVLPMLTILGLLGVGGLIVSLDGFTLLAFLTWAGVGLLFYAFYGIRNSREAHGRHLAVGAQPVAMTLGVPQDQDLIHDPKPRRVPAPRSAPSGAFTHEGYSLYKRTVVNKDGSERSLYFFAKGQPKSGEPSAKPKGYSVGVNERTGLPYLRKD
jgi:hypothetical protein